MLPLRRILRANKILHHSIRSSTSLSDPEPRLISEKGPNRLYIAGSKLYNYKSGSILPKDLGTCKSHKLLQYYGFIKDSHPGSFTILPLGLRSLKKLIRLIEQEMEAVGGQQVSMPTVLQAKMLKTSGRWNKIKNELVLVGNSEDECYLGPTHEEPVTCMAASEGAWSEQQLGFRLYQITWKYRNEMKPKHGLLRATEFLMKDMYTFDSSEAAATETYHSVCETYCRVFDRLGVPYEKVLGSCGKIGGSLSHEFHFLAECGEDKLLMCPRCGMQMNIERAEELANSQLAVEEVQAEVCQKDKEHCQLTVQKGIEVGHCFNLGTTYTSKFSTVFQDEDGNIKPVLQGCFGLGVTRILQAAVEVLSKERHIRWPPLIAPYQVCIVPQKEGYQADQYFRLAEKLSDSLSSLPQLRGEVVIDDRLQYNIGQRITEAYRMGYPYIVALGKKALQDPGQVEVISTASGCTRGDLLTPHQLLDLMSGVQTL